MRYQPGIGITRKRRLGESRSMTIPITGASRGSRQSSLSFDPQTKRLEVKLSTGKSFRRRIYDR